MRLQFLATLLMTTAILLCACDDTPEIPQAVLDQAKKASEQPRSAKIPTTQELLTSKRIRMTLLPLPLTMEAPVGWGKLGDNNPAGIKVSEAGLNIIQGYTPGGPIQIQLTSRPLVKEDALQRILEAGKKEMAERPQQFIKFELHPLGSVKVLERQSVGQPRLLTLYDESGGEHTSMESSFNWTISVLVPNEGAYQDFTLSFIDLTKSHYDKDAEFLNSIVNTIKYAGDAAGAEPATVPASHP